MSNQRLLKRLFFLALIAALGFNYPLLFLPSGRLLGLPAQWLYLFALWCLLILLAAIIVRYSSTESEVLQDMQEYSSAIKDNDAQ